VHSFTVGPASGGSLDATLASSGLPIAVVDLHAVSQKTIVAEWFARPNGTRGISADYLDALRTNTFPEIVAEYWDALFFVERTTAARPVEGGKRPGIQRLAIPANLDSESGEVGKPPPDWVIPPGVVNFMYQVGLSPENPHGGKQSAVIS
jgi:hypothetical protein